MTKTLVERLRLYVGTLEDGDLAGILARESADRIEKLEAALRPFAEIIDVIDELSRDEPEVQAT